MKKGNEQRSFQANVRKKTIAPVFEGIKSVIASGGEYFLDLFLNVKPNQKSSFSTIQKLSYVCNKFSNYSSSKRKVFL